MHIRPYQPGDEATQVEIYNDRAALLPGFKPATAEEVARRYKGSDPDPGSKLYAVEGGEVVGYVVFNPNGRVSYPWCRTGAEACRTPLLRAALGGLVDRGRREAWAAYRADWRPVHDFFRAEGFRLAREMVNFVAEVRDLPNVAPGGAGQIGPLSRDEVGQVLELGRGVFEVDEPEALGAFYFDNPYFGPDSLFALRGRDGRLVGVGLAVADPRFADPTKVDPAMPCFRLGAMGTESERHKRINGLFSAVFAREEAGEALLVEAARRFEAAGLAHVAAQAASDDAARLAFHDRYFRRQGGFPILSRTLDEA